MTCVRLVDRLFLRARIAATILVALCSAPSAFAQTTSFSAASVSYPTSDASQGVAFADLNHDNIPDLVVAACGCVNNVIRVRLGDGHGGFGAPTDIPVLGASPFGVAIADLNGDTHPDIVTADSFSDDITILWGTGTGAFPTQVQIPVGAYPQWVAVADLDGDGDQDIAVSNLYSSSVTILLGDGAGSFVESTSSPILTGFGPLLLHAADVNGDGLADIVVPNGNDDTVTVILSNGDGTFTGLPNILLPSGTAPDDLAIVDLNGDLKPDLAVVGYGTADLTILYGDGSGAFVAGAPLAAGIAPVSAVAGDFNGDGLDDVIVADSGGDGIIVFQGDGVGLSAGTALAAGGIAPMWTAAADVNGDGRLDLAVASLSVDDTTLLLNDTCCLVTISRAGAGTGTVSSVPPGLNCGPTCFKVFDPLVAPQLTATPAAGYLLSGWSGACTGTGTCSVAAGADATVTATFDPLALSTAAFPGGAVGNAYSVAASTTDGTGPFVFTLESGALPVGLGLSPSGQIAGTPLQSGMAIFTLRGTDTNGATGTRAYAITIAPGATVTTTSSQSVAYRASAQDVTLTASVASGTTVSGGTVTFTVRDSASRVIGAAATGGVTAGRAAATYVLPAATPVEALTITATYGGTTDFTASAATAVLQVTCSLTIGPAAPPPLRLGRPFAMTLAAPAPDATFSIGGTVPPGLTLNGAILGGSPAALGRYDVNVTATSASEACTTTRAYSLSVMRAPVLMTGAGSGTQVRAYDNQGVLADSLDVSDAAFSGGVRVAMGDVTGDGIADIIMSPGAAAASAAVRVIDGATRMLIRQFDAYPAPSPGGVFVAAGDVNGDGIADIVTGRDDPSAEVRVFDGRTGAVIVDFFAYPAHTVGGVHVAAGDLDADGFAEIIAAPGAGSGPLVRVFNRDGTFRESFDAYDPAFVGGVDVAAGDVDGDGHADIVTGAGPGGGPHVRVFSGVDLHEVRGFMAYDPAFVGGVRVAAGDLDLDGHAEVITAAGPGGGPHVRVWDGATGSEVAGWMAFDPAFADGVFVAAPPDQSRVVVDTPVYGSSVGSLFLVGGWTALAGAAGDSGADVVHVWALPVAAGAPIFVGAAAVGVVRPDVAAVLGGDFTNAGFNVIGGPLPSGSYDLVVFAHSRRSDTFVSRAIVRIVVP